MERSLRPSGIPFLGALPWGSHICQFYRTPADLLDLLVPWFKAGLENNEYCIWLVATPLTCAEAESALRSAVRDFDARLACGQILILSSEAWYRTAGTFDPDRVFQAWNTRTSEALAKGYEGLRVTGDASWVRQQEWRAFMDYESRCDTMVSNARVLGLCTYPLQTCGTDEVLDAMKNHAFALVLRDGCWQVFESQERRRNLQSVNEFQKKYETLFSHMLNGFAYHRVICDANGKPVDYLFLEANAAFERMTGLKRDELIGRCATEVLPGIDSEPDWLERFGRVALTGEPVRFQQFSVPLGKWFTVSAYSPEHGYFALTMEESSEPHFARTALSA